MLSKLSPPHVEDPAQYVHIPKRHSGIFRDHDRRIDSSWSHRLFRCRLCTITWSTKTRGVHFTPIQACTFPARKLPVGRGCDQPKIGPACFSLRPISVQQQRRAAPLHNVYIVQFFFLSTERGGTHCPTSRLSYYWTYICPNALGRKEQWEN